MRFCGDYYFAVDRPFRATKFLAAGALRLGHVDYQVVKRVCHGSSLASQPVEKLTDYFRPLRGGLLEVPVGIALTH
jgi:hypothetical protein